MSTPHRDAVHTRLADLESLHRTLLRVEAERGLADVVLLGTAMRKAVRPTTPTQDEGLRRRIEEEERWERAFDPWYERMFAETIARLPEAYEAAQRRRIRKGWLAPLRKARYLPGDADPAQVNALLAEYRTAPKRDKPRIEALIRTLTGMEPQEARVALMNTLQTYTEPSKHAIMEALLADQAAAEALGAEMFLIDGVQLYLQMAGQTGKVAGQTALQYMGLGQTFDWAHPQNMPRSLYSVRGSKVIHGIYGEHLKRLSSIIAAATDPRNPMTMSQVESALKQEWPKLKAAQVKMIARTETAAVWTATSMNAYEVNGIDRWESTIAHGPSIEIAQSSPCEICVAQATMGSFSIHSGEIPPWHPSCRCEAIPVLENEYGDPWLPPDEPWTGGSFPDGFLPTIAPPPGEPFGGLAFAPVRPGARDAFRDEISESWVLGDQGEQALRALNADDVWMGTNRSGTPLMVAAGETTDDIVHISSISSRAGGARHAVTRLARDARDSGRSLVIDADGVSPQLRETLDGWGFKYDEARGTYTMRPDRVPDEWHAIEDLPGADTDFIDRRIGELERRFATVTDPALKRDIGLRLDSMRAARQKILDARPKASPAPEPRPEEVLTDGPATEALDKHYEEWGGKLTNVEQDALNAWRSEKGTVAISENLRAPGALPDHTIDLPSVGSRITLRDAVTKLDDIIERSPGSPVALDMSVFRGVNTKMFGPNGPKVGDVVEETSYTATTTERRIAEEYARQAAARVSETSTVLMEVLVPQGTKGAWMRSAVSDMGNHEFLLARGAQFRIVDVEVQKLYPHGRSPTVTTVKVELLPAKTRAKPEAPPPEPPPPPPVPKAPEPPPPPPIPETVLVDTKPTPLERLPRDYTPDWSTREGWEEFLSRLDGESVRVTWKSGTTATSGAVKQSRSGKWAVGRYHITSPDQILQVEVKYGGRYKDWAEWRTLPPKDAVAPRAPSGPRQPRETKPREPAPTMTFEDSAPSGALGDVPATPEFRTQEEATQFAEQFLAGEVSLGSATELAGLHQMMDGLAKVLRPYGVKLDHLRVEKPRGNALAIFGRGTARTKDGYISGTRIQSQVGVTKTKDMAKKNEDQNRIHREQKASSREGYMRMLTDETRWPMLEKQYGPNWRDIVNAKIDEVDATKRWIVAHSVPDPTRALFAHEAGHALDYAYDLRGIFAQYLKAYGVPRVDKLALSEYGASEVAEVWAEAIAARVVGADMPPSIAQALDDTLARIPGRENRMATAAPTPDHLRATR